MNQVVPLAPTLARPTGSLTHPNPVGRLVTRTPESVRLHEGFQQVKGVVVALVPVGSDAPGNLRKNMAGQMPNADPGQDQKTAVVGDELQARSTLLTRPTDPLVSASALPGGSAKEQAGQFNPGATLNQIAEVLANGTAIAQIMMLGQIPPEQLIVRLLGADHLDLQGLEPRQIANDRFGNDCIKRLETHLGRSPNRPSSAFR